MQTVNLIAYAAGLASNNNDCHFGPLYLQQHPEFFQNLGLLPQWVDTISCDAGINLCGLDVFSDLKKILQQMIQSIQKFAVQGKKIVFLGGDHSMAMASWTAMMQAYHRQESIGLLWIDAHMDAHSPDTSVSKNIHGMPLSYLLGAWHHAKFELSQPRMVLNPEHVVVIGIRSYETGEHEILKNLGVKIYFMDEVERRGIQVVMHEAHTRLLSLVDAIGVSIDLDAFDPNDCPGVGYREPGGIHLSDFIDYFKQQHHKDWVGLEIAEFNPRRDVNNKTALAIVDLIKAVYF